MHIIKAAHHRPTQFPFNCQSECGKMCVPGHMVCYRCKLAKKSMFHIPFPKSQIKSKAAVASGNSKAHVILQVNWVRRPAFSKERLLCARWPLDLPCRLARHSTKPRQHAHRQGTVLACAARRKQSQRPNAPIAGRSSSGRPPCRCQPPEKQEAAWGKTRRQIV